MDTLLQTYRIKLDLTPTDYVRSLHDSINWKNRLIAILPLISQQKYNVAIKKILKHAGIDRVVTRLNPTTGEPEHRVISDILSSHSARKAFSGNIYDKVPDPNLICPLTGHKEGSKAFNRYRKIDEDTNRKTVSLLE